MILLDTNICIAALNTRPVSVLEHLKREAARGAAPMISTISIFELRYGVAKSQRVAANTRALDVFLRELDVLSFAEEDARIAGDIRADLERSGRPIGPYDYLVAAQAIRRDLTLITANEKEFSRVPGLRWENWLSPRI